MKSLQIALAALALSACATGGLSDNDKLALYRAHALAPVESFHYFNRIDGWTPLVRPASPSGTRATSLGLAFRLPRIGTPPD